MPGRTICLSVVTFVVALLFGCSVTRSQSTGVELNTQLDVPYSSRSGLNKLDIYAPKSVRNAPVVIMVHGGGWQIGDKSNRQVWENKVPFFTGAGYVFVNINYRLSPAVRHPEHIRDVAEAVAWVYDNIGKYGGSKDKIFVMGHSAGAHLAALVATDDRRLKEFGKDLSIIKGAILLDGAGYDIPQQMKGSTVIGRRTVIGQLLAEMYVNAFTTDESVQRDASPYFHIAKGKHIPPFLLFTAGGRPDSVGQSKKMVEALRAAGVRAETIDDPTKDHGSINRRFGVADEMITKKAQEFLDSILKR